MSHPTAIRYSDLLRVDRLDDGRRELVRPLEIGLGEDLAVDHPCFPTEDRGEGRGPETVAVVPRGFRTDFSSIPGLARWLYRFSKVDLAGVVHDLAYRVGVDRRVADSMWRIVAESGRTRVGPLRGWLAWAGLRIGAWPAYQPTGDPLVHRDDAI